MRAVDYDVIVLGADLNGLTAAAYLAKAGVRVLVLEEGEVPGGAAVTEELFPGFRVDTCAHDAGWVPPDIVRHLGLTELGVEVFRPDPTVYAPNLDGPAVTLWRDPERTSRALRRHTPADASKWPAFVRQMHGMAGVLERLYRAPPLHPTKTSAADLRRLLGAAWHLRRSGRSQIAEFLRVVPMSVADLLDDWFDNDVLKGALGATGVTAMLQGPRSGGTSFVFLHHHVGADPGVYRARGLVRGGIGTLAAAIAASATRQGAEVRCRSGIARVLIENGRAQGVELTSGQQLQARCVVSSVDAHRTFLELVDASSIDPEFRRAVCHIKHRGTWAKVNLALAELPRFTGLQADDGELRGVISISPSLDYLERAYDDAKYGAVSRQPSLEITIPSLRDQDLSPPGKHVMSITVQYVPYGARAAEGDSHPTPSDPDRLGDAILTTLAAYVPNLTDVVIHRQVVRPEDIEERFGLREGHLYQGELTLDQILFMRPVAGWARYRTPIPGLFLCGSAAHPAGGIAGGAGRNAARVVIADLKNGKP